MKQIETLLNSLNGADVRYVVIGEIEAPFACLEDIIQMKKAAGRPKDIEDIRQLEKLRDLDTED